MKLSEILDPNECSITEAEIWEMARVTPAESGLPYVLFVSGKEYVQGRHGPRLKVSNVPGTFSNNDCFVIAIANPPFVVAGTPKYNQNEVNNILDWVRLNHDALIKYWNNLYDKNVDFYNELQKI